MPTPTTDKKINELAKAMKKGFAAITDKFGTMATKEDLTKMATKADVARMATKEDLTKMATKDELHELARMTAKGFANTATKEELKELRLEMKQGFAEQRSDIEQMLEEHLGLVRTDYDSLARRTKKLEEKVFNTR